MQYPNYQLPSSQELGIRVNKQLSHLVDIERQYGSGLFLLVKTDALTLIQGHVHLVPPSSFEYVTLKLEQAPCLDNDF
jgi:hypothetical protein